MFLSHFKMTAQPFLERTPADRMLRDERMSQGLARLEYLANAGSIALVTGHTGVGKSSLLKLFLHTLTKNRYLPLYLHLTDVTATSLLKLVVAALGEEPRRGKERLFLQILERTRSAELTPILILDEAHLLDPQALTDLRLLVSSALEEAPPLKILLCGQETLRDQLKRASHADFVHRISVRYHLRPLTKEETASYVDFQMNASGASEKIFEPEAKDLVHEYANGVPRQINNVATASLLNAAARKLQKINAELVNETMEEFHLP
jgi:general secretion pathway protein A